MGLSSSVALTSSSPTAPGPCNIKPDALSRQFSVEEKVQEEENILPTSRVFAAITWDIENAVLRAQQQQPDPGQGPPGRLFVPDAVRQPTLLPSPSSPQPVRQPDLLANHVVRLHGIPRDIVSDRGPQFISQVWKSSCTGLGASVSLTSGFHPQSNGQTERTNQDLVSATLCHGRQPEYLVHIPPLGRTRSQFPDGGARGTAVSGGLGGLWSGGTIMDSPDDRSWTITWLNVSTGTTLTSPKGHLEVTVEGGVLLGSLSCVLSPPVCHCLFVGRIGGRVRVNMVRLKELSEAIRKKIAAAHESGERFKEISKEFEISYFTVWKIVYKWRTFKTTANVPRSGRPSKFTQRADRKMLKEVIKSPKISSWDLQLALATVDVKVHDSTIRKRLHSLTLMGGVQGGNLRSLKRTLRPG
ncbi:hypothetical protein L3Q82_009675 [Scortum barcoo]|uniref:Uncharacterized protein n=1 Tax=Scortum barcoo TaxID=214431 RepID=A0ACB8WGQ4_9TELE|nr:hypothetical protein L3Q82_009675 [Scortum barcoo]